MYDPIFKEPRSAGLLMLKQVLLEYLTFKNVKREKTPLKTHHEIIKQWKEVFVLSEFLSEKISGHISTISTT